MDKYAYLLINIFTVLGPLALSPLAPANQKAFLKKIFPSILIIAVIFIIHDIVFTDLGVWGFNYFYLTGMNIFNLPVEEVLFFICIPFGSLFIHATVTVQKPKWKIADSFLNIFSAYYKNEMIAGILNIKVKDDVSLAFYISHKEKYQDLRPLNLLFYSVFKWAIKEKIKVYDFGIFTIGGEPNMGLGRFKENFGASGIFRDTLQILF